MATENDDYNEEYEELASSDDNSVELYSRWAIWGFSIFFSSLFGAVLLVRNLFAAGLKKAGYGVLAFAVVYFLATNVLIIATGLTALVFLINIGAGFLYAEYFYRKYFPDDNYYPKPIWNALAIAFGVTIAIMLLLKFLDPALLNEAAGVK